MRGRRRTLRPRHRVAVHGAVARSPESTSTRSYVRPSTRYAGCGTSTAGIPTRYRRRPVSGRVAPTRRLAADGLPVSPWYYDVPESLLRSGTEPEPSGAPGPNLVEEPQVRAHPTGSTCRRVYQTGRGDQPLVIKSPSNAYRMDFVRALFPNARVSVLHLARNPAAAINGLYDGWRHRGFHAHRMPSPLAIEGYADATSDNRWWWKLDLPPGWTAYTGADLLGVCAFQWRSTHRAILNDASCGGPDYLRVRFEDLIRPGDARVETMSPGCALGSISRWTASSGGPRTTESTPSSRPHPRRPGAGDHEPRRSAGTSTRRARDREGVGYDAEDTWI